MRPEIAQEHLHIASCAHDLVDLIQSLCPVPGCPSIRELEQLADSADVSEGPEETYIADERKKQLYRALDKLDPGYREVLWLSFFEDMTPDAISAVTGKKRNYVYQQISRAKLALKTELEKEGFEYDGS